MFHLIISRCLTLIFLAKNAPAIILPNTYVPAHLTSGSIKEPLRTGISLVNVKQNIEWHEIECFGYDDSMSIEGIWNNT